MQAVSALDLAPIYHGDGLKPQVLAEFRGNHGAPVLSQAAGVRGCDRNPRPAPSSGACLRPSNPETIIVFIALLIFVLTPLVELYFMIQVGSVIGALPTIGLSLLTAAIGGLMVRHQGLSVLMRVRAQMERGETPALEMLDGAVLLVCGFALLLPGFVTDVIGFLLLIPPLRHALLRRWVHVVPIQARAQRDDDLHRIIEGDYRREDP